MTPTDTISTARALLAARLPFLLMGPPGVGKSAFCAAAAAPTHNVVLLHPSVSEPTDVHGLPMLRGDSAVFAPFDEMVVLRDASAPTLVVLEDLGQATTAVQASWMQLIHARALGSFRVSDCVTFAATSNRAGDKAGAGRLISALRNRFAAIIDVEVSAADFVEYCDDRVNPLVPRFVAFYPAALTDAPSDTGAFSSPRSLEAAGKILDLRLPGPVQNELLVACLGAGIGRQFAAFIQHASSLPSIGAIFANPHDAPVVTELAQRYAVTTALAAAASAATFGAGLAYVRRIQGAEYETVYVTTATRITDRSTDTRRAKVALICATSEFTQWAAAHNRSV